MTFCFPNVVLPVHMQFPSLFICVNCFFSIDYMHCLSPILTLNAKLLYNALLLLLHLGLEQDIFDVIMIPTLAVFTYKIDFFTWVCFTWSFVCFPQSHYEWWDLLSLLCSGYAWSTSPTWKRWAILACVLACLWPLPWPSSRPSANSPAGFGGYNPPQPRNPSTGPPISWPTSSNFEKPGPISNHILKRYIWPHTGTHTPAPDNQPTHPPLCYLPYY